MPSDQDDVDAMFGGGAPAAEPKASPFAARPSADSRKESRVRANWPARVLLPDERILQLNVFDLSEGGIGLVTQSGIPANTVLQVALAVPGLDDPRRITPVTGTIRTTHVTVRGPDLHCGGNWVSLPADSRDLINEWVRRLRAK